MEDDNIRPPDKKKRDCLLPSTIHEDVVVDWQEESEDLDLWYAIQKSMMDAEDKRSEECLRKFGLVRSRLRLLRSASDPIVDQLLELIDWECTPEYKRQSSHPPVFDNEKIELWLKEQKSPVFLVLHYFLNKNMTEKTMPSRTKV